LISKSTGTGAYRFVDRCCPTSSHARRSLTRYSFF
jgi:hypothetical protein